MRRAERVTVQGPVKKQQPDGMPHRGARIREGDPTVFFVQRLNWDGSMHPSAEWEAETGVVRRRRAR